MPSKYGNIKGYDDFKRLYDFMRSLIEVTSKALPKSLEEISDVIRKKVIDQEFENLPEPFRHAELSEEYLRRKEKAGQDTRILMRKRDFVKQIGPETWNHSLNGEITVLDPWVKYYMVFNELGNEKLPKRATFETMMLYEPYRNEMLDIICKNLNEELGLPVKFKYSRRQS